MAFLSPLRYPGGKGLLLDFVDDVIRNSLGTGVRYVEPFVGGAAVAIGLLSRGIADRAVIGDIDPAVAAFWRGVFFHNEEFVDRVRECAVTIDAWHGHWQTLNAESVNDDLQLGFSAFFLNRTNYSGILRARPIGGLEQTGDWRLDCRFNKEDLVRRIKKLDRFSDRVDVFEGSACDLLDGLPENDVDDLFVYADPPYLMKSADLYLDETAFDTHVRLAAKLRSMFRYWIVSYDRDSRVGSVLFPNERIARFSIRHSASRAHIGQELAVFSDDCAVSGSLRLLKSAVMEC